MKRLLLVASLAALDVSAFAQAPAPTPGPQLMDYIQEHGAFVSGILVANGERSEFLSVSIDHDFRLAPRVRAFVGLSFFSRQREASGDRDDSDATPTPSPTIPTSLENLGAYSEGEGIFGAYFEITPKLAWECRAGLTWAMIAITGHDVGAPIDGSKFLFGCGPRLTGGVGTVSVLLSHYGPVLEGARFFGFLPSLVFAGRFRLSDSMDFLAHVAAGRDLSTHKAVTASRFSVRKGFGR